MNHAIRIHETGGPEKMVWEEVPLPAPKPGEALVRHKAVGLNYIDVYFRTGLYKAPSMPAIIGMEASGIVEAIGEGVTEVKVGDRVAYATGPIGAYAEARAIKADRLVKMPEAISLDGPRFSIGADGAGGIGHAITHFHLGHAFANGFHNA